MSAFKKGDSVTIACKCSCGDGGRIGYTPGETQWEVLSMEGESKIRYRVQVVGKGTRHTHYEQCLTHVKLPEGVEGYE